MATDQPDKQDKSIIHVEAGYPDFILSGGLTEDSPPIRVSVLMRHIFADLPAPDDVFGELEISALKFEADPKHQLYCFEAQIDDVWSFPFDLGENGLEITGLSLFLEYVNNNIGARIAGGLELFGKNFTVSAERPVAGDWILAGSLDENERISLPALVDEIIMGATGTSIELHDSLAFDINELGLRFDTGIEKRYTFQSGFEWNLPLGDGIGVNIAARLFLETWKGSRGEEPRKYAGEIAGVVSFESLDAEFFRNFAIGASYRFQPESQEVCFLLRQNGFEVSACVELQKGEGEKPDATILHFGFGDTTFGDLLTFMVQLVDPEIEAFRLEAPWDALSSISLAGLELGLNLKTLEASVSYELDLNLGFVRIDALGLKYAKPTGVPKGQPALKVEIVGMFLGQSYDRDNPLSWDALDESPPAVPGAGSALFDLQYLGLGQHITFQDVSQLTTVALAIDALILALEEDTPENPLVFNRDSGWLIGARFSLIDAVHLSFIFNDPFLYGLLISLSGEKVKSLQGLQFEILYRRITETIGLYHTELTLPDEMRQWNFGAVAITLPIIALDIYTNGDFLIDVGFPWDADFSRSAVVEAGIFMGSGGFYLAKLSGATATFLPLITNGNFNPVIAFGLGMKLGLGRTFNKGPLKAELSVTIQGIFEGALAWFNPDDPAAETDLYYRLQATVQIIGRLYGSVDFSVIKVEVEVLVYAGVRLTVEAYQPIEIMLVAGVRVRASIKILFIRIHFSFSLTIRQSFTIGSAQPTPWKIAPPDDAAVAFALAEPGIIEAKSFTPLYWDAFQVWDETKTLDIYFQPAFTEGLPTDRLASDAGNLGRVAGASDLGAADADAEVKGVALLFIANGIPQTAQSYLDFEPGDNADSTPSDFDLLAQALLVWAIRAHLDKSQQRAPGAGKSSGSGFSPEVGKIPRIDLVMLESLHQALVERREHHEMPFNLVNLVDFLSSNFRFNITDCNEDSQASFFPMFPQLSLTPHGSESAIRFDEFNQLTAGEVKALLQYFDDLKVGFDADEDEGDLVTANGQSKMSLASFIFLDYFSMLIRMSVESAAAYLEERSDELEIPDLKMDLEELLQGTVANGRFNQIAGMISRFLLHGLRLPLDPDAEKTYPLFALTGQQFEIPVPAELADPYHPYHLILEASEPEDVPWIIFEDQESVDARLEYPLQPDERGLIQELAHRQLSADIRSFKPLSLYQEHAQRFTLEHRIDWTVDPASIPAIVETSGDPETDESLTIWSFPQSLTDVLQKNGPIDLTLRSGTSKRTGSTAMTVKDIERFTWATMVEFQVRQVPDAAGTGVLADTYLVEGTSDTGQDLLERLWEFIHDQGDDVSADLFLLYAPTAAQEDPSGLLSDTPSNSLLLKTNLSTMTEPRRLAEGDAPQVYGASLADGADFIKLLWQCSAVETGGFFLHYTLLENGTEKGLPDYLFTDDKTAALRLIVIVDKPETRGTPPTRWHHNCAVLAEEISSENEVLFVESPEHLVKSLSVSPGHVGFHIERTRPDDIERTRPDDIERTRPDDNDANHSMVLDNLFQLLSFTVDEMPGFHASHPSLPVGPTLDLNDPDDPDDDVWTYKRVIPAYRLAEKPDDRFDELPPASRDPYAGIGKEAQIQVRFELQDVYGNLTFSEQPLEPLSLPVRYTDAIIGLHQWPSLIETYQFQEKGRQLAGLDLEFRLAVGHFMSTPGSPYEDVEQKIRSALATYERIYYQVHQVDVAFFLTSTINPAGSQALDRGLFSTLVDETYQFLATLEALERHPSDAGNGAPSGTLGAGQAADQFSLGSVISSTQVLVGNTGLADLATEDRPLADLAVVNQDLRGILQDGIEISLNDHSEPIEIRGLETLRTLAAVLSTPEAPLTVPTLVKNLSADAFVSGARVLVPPRQLMLSLDVSASPADFPEALIFPVQVGLEIRRDQLDGLRVGETLIHEDFEDVPEVRAVRSSLAPRFAPLPSDQAGEGDEIASMRQFAEDFERAFPQLKLAVGKEKRRRASPISGEKGDSAASTPLWAIHLGPSGMDYQFGAGSEALFFAPPPLSTTLLAGEVSVKNYVQGQGLTDGEPKKFQAIDLDSWARDFLDAVDMFLNADLAVQAFKRDADSVHTILSAKQTLAEAIANKVTHVLEAGQLIREVLDSRRQIAAAALRQQLLVQLGNAYAVETIVQLGVKVKLAKNPEGWTRENAPRLSGEPGVKEAGADVDYTLSSAKVPLYPDESYLTFLYNTPAPAEERHAALDLTFHINDLEYAIEPVAGIDNYESSSWLRFIIPLGETQNGEKHHLGEVKIPIPLRAYPVPPSLIMHRAEPPADERSLQEIRKWQYRYTYEHLDAAQDEIDSSVLYNVVLNGDSVPSFAAGTAAPNLFEALANFHELYPEIAPDLVGLASLQADQNASVPDNALRAFAELVRDTARAWDGWHERLRQETDLVEDYRYEIREAGHDEDTLELTVNLHGNGKSHPLPLIDVPGFDRQPQDGLEATRIETRTYVFTPKPEDQALLEPGYGVPAIPDRTITIPDRDVVHHQNAWASVWLARNRDLVEAHETNAAFIYQTPRIRFNNLVTPLVVNDRDCNLATLGTDDSTPQNLHLEEHIERMFQVLLPDISDASYDIRVACRYGFSLVSPDGEARELLSTLPVLLSTRFTVHGGLQMLAATEVFRASLAAAIARWRKKHDPLTQNGQFVFNFDIFSNLKPNGGTDDANLPLLQVDHLYVRLENIQ